MDFPFGETVTVRTPGTRTDRYNNTVADWTTASDLPISGVAVAPGGSTEAPDMGRDPVESDFDLFLPAGTTITAQDRVVVRGLVCEVVGRPFDYRSPFTGWAPGLVARVKIKEG